MIKSICTTPAGCIPLLFEAAEGIGVAHHAAQAAGKALGALLELLHHLLHHLKLLEQLVDVFHAGAAAGGDAALALDRKSVV